MSYIGHPAYIITSISITEFNENIVLVQYTRQTNKLYWLGTKNKIYNVYSISTGWVMVLKVLRVKTDSCYCACLLTYKGLKFMMQRNPISTRLRDLLDLRPLFINNRHLRVLRKRHWTITWSVFCCFHLNTEINHCWFCSKNSTFFTFLRLPKEILTQKQCFLSLDNFISSLWYSA